MSQAMEPSLGRVTADALELLKQESDAAISYAMLVAAALDGEWIRRRGREGRIRSRNGLVWGVSDGFLFSGLTALHIAAAREGLCLDYGEYENAVIGLPFHIPFTLRPAAPGELDPAPWEVCVLHHRAQTTWAHLTTDGNGLPTDRVTVAFQGTLGAERVAIEDDGSTLLLAVQSLGSGDFGVEIYDTKGEIVDVGYSSAEDPFKHHVPLLDAYESWAVAASAEPVDPEGLLADYQFEDDDSDVSAADEWGVLR